ncbi:MAG: DUF5615 family PIN-like protein [Paracoccus marcusii]
MRILVDENLPPALARALAELFINQHDVIHIRQRYGPGVKDVDWIKDLNADGHWTIISADRRISKNKAEQTAFRASRLIAFIFAPALQKATMLKKMERLMVMWPKIETQVGLVQGGSMFEIPAKGDRLRPV